VTADFNLNIFPIYRIKGQEIPNLPGILALSPPRRSARGRENDHLVIYLTLSGNTPLTSAEYSQITAQMGQRFYQIGGSLTAAMRGTVDVLNQFLVERNLRTTGKGAYIVGRLVLGVMRSNQLVLAQSGPTHVYHLTAEGATHFHDPQISGRGLGFSQTTQLYFTQAELHAGDKLVICAKLPTGWDAVLGGERGTASPDALARKLVSMTQDDISVILLETLPGTGDLRILRPTKSTVSTRATAEGATGPGDAAVQPQTPVVPPQSRPANRFQKLMTEADQQQSQVEPASYAVPLDEALPRAATGRRQRGLSRERRSGVPEISPPPTERRKETYRGLARLIQTVRKFEQNMSDGIRRMLPRLLPGLQENEERGISASTMVLITLGVAVVVVTIAVTVYMRYGRVAQYGENYDLAIQSAVGAIGQDDAVIIRHAWESALYYLDRAETYQITQDSQALRYEAQTALDGLEGIIRLNFRPAIYGGLDSTVQIIKMAANDTDLYLLNGVRGNILRAIRTNQGYEMDRNFLCDPGVYGEHQVGPLIDLAVLPRVNNRNAAVMAIDGNGTILYCSSGIRPFAEPLGPPDLGWRGISGFTLDTDGNNLYVLDSQANAVWKYNGDLGSFSDRPTFFFAEQVPEGMNTAIDLAVKGNDLFLLFEDGHIVICIQGQLEIIPVRCIDPATFEDSRPGHQSGPVITDAVLIQMAFAAPPDQSLYALEPHTHAVYRFSSRTDSLILQAQFRAPVDMENTQFVLPVTAMAISTNGVVFLSIDNQVYYATNIP